MYQNELTPLMTIFKWFSVLKITKNTQTSIYKGKQNLIDNFKAENILTLMANMDSPYHKGFIHPEELLSVAKVNLKS